jgi:hypothetical protein
MSIRQTADGFSLYIYNVLTGKLQQCDTVPLTGSISAEEVLRSQLTRPRLQDLEFVEVELVSELPATLIPLDEFRKSEVLPLYRLNYPNSTYTAYDIRCEVLSALEVVVAYPVPAAVEQVLHSLFPSVQVRSLLGQSLERFAAQKHSKKEGNSHFYALFTDSTMVLGHLADHKLQYACSYAVGNDADRVYYLLSVWKNLNLDSHTSCILYGAPEEVVSKVRKFIAIVREE